MHFTLTNLKRILKVLELLTNIVLELRGIIMLYSIQPTPKQKLLLEINDNGDKNLKLYKFLSIAFSLCLQFIRVCLLFD